MSVSVSVHCAVEWCEWCCAIFRLFKHNLRSWMEAAKRKIRPNRQSLCITLSIQFGQILLKCFAIYFIDKTENETCHRVKRDEENWP